MKIKTARLQEMMSKAMKGVGNNKLLPLTSLIAIKVEDGTLSIISTDATNYLYVSEKVESEDFYVCVQAEQISKLIARMTSDEISLEIKDNSLEVKGNGTYSIALPLDEDGSIVNYPNPYKDFSGEKIGVISNANIKTILNTLKPALAVTMDYPQYTNYFVGDCVIATDTQKINAISTAILEAAKLITSEMMNLLDVMTDDNIDIFAYGNIIVCKSSNAIVYGTSTFDIEDFNVAAIKNLINQEFPSKCVIQKTNLLQLLDRISLFVDTFDDGAIVLTFTKDGLLVESKQSSGSELIPYVSCENFNEFIASVDVFTLQTQIKAQPSDTIEMWFGEQNALKVVNDNITSIIALLETE